MAQVWKQASDYIRSGGRIILHKRLHTDKVAYKLMSHDNRPVRILTQKTLDTMIKHRRVMRINPDVRIWTMNPVWRKVRRDNGKQRFFYQRDIDVAYLNIIYHTLLDLQVSLKQAHERAK